MHQQMCQYADFVANGEIQGQLYWLGSYPGVVTGGAPSYSIKGELYKVIQPEPLWLLLDEYEGCKADDAEPHEYRKALISVELANGSAIDAMIYLYNRDPGELPLIVSGDYLEFTALQQF